MRAMPTPLANDGPRFRSDMAVSELTECDTQAIEASDVSSTPPIAETSDGVTCGGSKKVGLARRRNARSQNDGSDPREGIRAKN